MSDVSNTNHNLSALHEINRNNMLNYRRTNAEKSGLSSDKTTGHSTWLSNNDNRTAAYILHHLASLKLTLVVLVALGAGVLAAYLSEVRTTWMLVGPLTLFAVNLSAAVATNPVFQRQIPLLVFHLALIVIVLLIAVGRLTYLNGTLELTNGVPFNGELTSSEAGPLHRGNLKGVRFVNEGFEIDYATGVKRGQTRNRVRWWDEDGGERAAVIGDQHPLEILNYKFYTSSNKGFAPLFVWMPDNGEPIKGAVHLPSYPTQEYKQQQEWILPGSGLKLWTQLQFDEIILDPARPSQFRLPERHKIVVRHGTDRHEMQPGDHVKFPGGMLVYEGLTSWMGYTVFYDWTISWLLYASIVAVLSLAWHFWRKFAERPW
ncbi:MAG: cytochrome c biogenesis protein ResB [Gallionella sp.]|nr:cytochrome c biogenesis protein ResB [Gallionella sp.]